mgnify:CR=1 FL=1
MSASGKKASFERNEDNPLEADVIFFLYYHMIYAYFFEKIGRFNAVVGINVYLVRFFKKMLYSVLVG